MKAFATCEQGGRFFIMEEQMQRITTRTMVLSAFFIALGILLPFITGQIPAIGSRLLPMHIPVLLAGFICGGPAGALVGLVTPLLRSLLFGFPPIFPTALAMAFELAAYGFVSGQVYRLLPKKPINIYLSLFAALIAGRIVWGVVSWVLFSLTGSAFTWQIFAAGAVINALPGLAIQIVLIPLIIMALQRARIFEFERL